MVQLYSTLSGGRSVNPTFLCIAMIHARTAGLFQNQCVKSREYSSWSAMRQRCTSPKHEAYERYAGRGITICERWNSFGNFLEDMGPRPIGMTLERINNNKGYSKENCKWATLDEQGRNRRNNRMHTINGVTKSTVEWCETYGMPQKVADKRIQYGWEGERIFTTPVRKYGSFTINGVTKSLRIWCVEFGLKFTTVRNRVLKGWPIEDLFIPIIKGQKRPRIFDEIKAKRKS